MKAIAKDPNERFATTLEFKNALESGSSGPMAQTAMLGAPPQLTPTITPSAAPVAPRYASTAQINAPQQPATLQPLLSPAAPTERSASWRLSNSLWILWTFTVVLNWVAFLVIGSRTQTKKWLIWGGVYAIPLLLAIFSEPSYSGDDLDVESSYNLATIGWIASIVHAFLVRGEYLRLLSAQEAQSSRR